MYTRDRLILALDVSDPAAALRIVEDFSDELNTFKVGLELFTSAGPGIVGQIQSKGKRVFLDLKFHDIPNTMVRAALAAARLGVHMFNMHTLAGYDALRKVKDAVTEFCLKENLPRPKMLGVTVLTSLSQEELKAEFGVQHSLRTHVKNLSLLASRAGLDGVVASGLEVSMIREHCGKDFIIVTPGIRPSWTPPDDQKRAITPRQAVKEGADYLVLGRAVLAQKEPVKALELITLEIMTA